MGGVGLELTSRMDFAYIAFTDDCSFGLDDAGICRAISPRAGASQDAVGIARRCVGAQYVASLDASAEGLLTQLPKPGTRLLFARTEAHGRIVLLRSGTLERFVSQDDVTSTSELPTVRTASPVRAVRTVWPAPVLLLVPEENASPLRVTRSGPRRR